MRELGRQLNLLEEKRRQYIDGAYENLHSAMGYEKASANGITAILAYYRLPTTLDDSLSIEKQLEFIADRYDVHTRRINLQDDWYHGTVLPILVQTEEGYRAILPSMTGFMYICENGKRRRVTKKEQHRIGNDALCFYRCIGEVNTVSGFLKYLFGSVGKYEKLCIFLLNLLGILIGIAVPAVYYIIFYSVIPSASRSDIFPMACILLSVGGTMFAANIVQSRLLSNAVLKMGVYAQGALFAKLLRLKAAFFANRKSGEVSDGIVEFSNAAVSMGAAVFSNGISAVLSFVYLIQMIYYIQDLGYIVLGIAVTLTMFLVLYTYSTLKWKKKSTESSANMTAFVYEFFSEIEKIKLNGAEERMFHRWSGKFADFTKARIKPFLVKYESAIRQTVTIGATALLFFSVAGQSARSAEYIAFYAAYGAFLAILLRIPVTIESAAIFVSTLRLVQPIIEADAEKAYGQAITPNKEEIQISHLSFCYPGEKRDVIYDLNLTIKPGECVGITGASGCGKSTLLRLILGFEEDYRGNIFVGSTNLKEMDKNVWRRNIGTVLQNSKLMKSSVFANITLTHQSATIEEVQQVIRFVGLENDIADMPMGMHTIVSEDNCPISGGQRQRILIARALIDNPNMILFDEATSALDNIHQSDVMDYISRIDATKIIIAHRLSTLKNCKRILVLEHGRLAADGDFDTLMETSPAFVKLMGRQRILNDVHYFK